MKQTGAKKRPCAICHRWFMPHPRQGERQKTCGRVECQRERHRRQCGKWNRKNTAYFKANYLADKLERNKEPPNPSVKKAPSVVPKSRIHLGLPRNMIMEKIGSEFIIILEYVLEQLIRRQSKTTTSRPP